MKIGTVFNYLNLPDVSKYPFVIKKRSEAIVRKGQFVYTKSLEGFLIGVVEKIILANEYFSDALTIKSYNTNNNPNILKGLFPSEDFEFAIAIVNCLGIIKFRKNNTEKIKKIVRMTYPARPGEDVFLVDKDLLNEILGFNPERGLYLGKVKVSKVPAKIDMNRLLNKHFSILAISGAGKSYLTSIIIEELLTRPEDYGTPAIILIDVHGEYTYLDNIDELKSKINVQNINYFQISVPNLKPIQYRKYQTNMSGVQIRELSKYIKELKKNPDKKNKFTIKDIIELIELDDKASKATKQALIGWLSELNDLMLFGAQENPYLPNLIKPQKLIIFDLSNEISIRKKQIIVDYLCYRLFNLRRAEKIPPFLLIIEEAHQFCPEASQSNAISKAIIETISREGRKFMACLCLISQRPKKLSTTALSQLNTKMILNIKNPYDLKHLMDSSEAITKNYAEMISSLGIGEMLLIGNAVNYPVFIDIRRRRYYSRKENISLSNYCLDWQKRFEELL